MRLFPIALSRVLGELLVCDGAVLRCCSPRSALVAVALAPLCCVSMWVGLVFFFDFLTFFSAMRINAGCW